MNQKEKEVKQYEFENFPHLHRVAPFRIIGNLYFAGDDNVGVHILDTGEGLMMIDTAYPQTQALLIEAIWELGFRPQDLRLILHTHAHYDHIGTTNLLARLSGAKICISAQDFIMMRERPEMTYCGLGSHFDPDILLCDGDTVRLGNTSVRVVSAPGHTMGTLAFFGTVKDRDGMEYTWGMHGGVGLNTLSKDYITRFGLTGARKAYIETLEKLTGEHVDIMLGNHTNQNHTIDKRKKMMDEPNGKNPFIDHNEWPVFLNMLQMQFSQMIKNESEQSKAADAGFDCQGGDAAAVAAHGIPRA